jgi:ATP-dependent protease ClpP protease subunit
MKKNDEPPIVCGTGFSATATEAVDIAAAMTRRLETSLVLIHPARSFSYAQASVRPIENKAPSCVAFKHKSKALP